MIVLKLYTYGAFAFLFVYNILIYSLLKIIILLKSLSENREREEERAFICWSVPQRLRIASVGPDRGQELIWVSHVGTEIQLLE